MSLFVIFVFGAVVFGAGFLLAPALPMSAQRVRQHTAPRIGLAAAVALGIVVAGSLFLAGLSGWDVWHTDYLLFALLIGVLLGRTLARTDQRNQESGLTNAQIGWPGPRELLFFALALGIFAAPVLVLPVPLDTDAQGFGYLALMLRDSGSMTTLAPLHPEIDYLYSPGFPTLAAYLSSRLGNMGIGLHTIQFGISAVLAALFLWVMWDFGNEIEDWLDDARGKRQAAGDKRQTAQSPDNKPGDLGVLAVEDSNTPPIRHAGVVLALTSLIGIGLFTAYMDSHYTAVMALVFALAFLVFITRYLRAERPPDALAAAVCLGMVPLTHPDTTIILMLGYIPWLGTIWLAKPRPSRKAWLVMAVVVPLIAVIGILPWISKIAPLLGSGIESPFTISIDHWRTLVFMHGGLIVPFVIGGAILALRRRNPLDVLMVGWLLLIIDFSTTGVLRSLAPGLLAPILKYDYPFSIAWHGPIIPYAYLSGRAILWLAARIGWMRIERLAWPALRLAGLALVLGIVFAQPLLELSKGRIGFFGAFSSAADVEAMVWLRDNTPPDTRILNYPGPQEADWAPIISERDTIYFRPQPFFRNIEAVEAEQAALRLFWQNPASPDHSDLLRRYDVEYVLVPQVVTDPASIVTMWRWRPPFSEALEMDSAVEDASYLELVADFDGARVYAVVGEPIEAGDQ